MDKKLVKKLADAGVEPAVIINLLLSDDEEEQEKPAQIPDPPAQASQEKPAEPVIETVKPAASNDAILAAIEKLTGAIHAGNIRAASAGEPAQPESAETILANLLHPQPGK